jgi:RHS repeat-associated protein
VIDRDEAIRRARAAMDEKSAAAGQSFVLLEDETREESFGWVFFFQSEAFVNSGEFRDRLVGNAPFVIRRYYDPQTGQFLSVDPAVDQTEAPYAYADGDPVDSTDPLGLGITDLLNPWSSHNPIREWAAGGSLASNLLYLNPAYVAVMGYGAEAQAWENGCSLWTVARDGALGTVGLASLALWFPTSAAMSAGEVTTVTIGPKIAGQMEARGWTSEAIEEAMSSGKQVRAINRATGNPATRYINLMTGQSVVVDDVTGEVIHVGGPGFKYGPGSGDVP